MSHPLKDNLQSATFDNQLIELESVDSSNNYAMARIHAGMATDGMVYLAHHQTAGKGQRGKTWQSEAGQNLMMSLIIRPGSLILSQQFLLSAAVALGIRDLAEILIGRDSSQDKNTLTIKWPNDIYYNDRKAAGILIESIIQGPSWPFAVIGLGMNLNQESFPDDVPNGISMKQITGKRYEPVAFARELTPSIQNRISMLRESPDRILTEFNLHLYKKDQSIVLKKGNELIVTTLNGVNESGHIMTDIGSFNLDEVKLVVEH